MCGGRQGPWELIPRSACRSADVARVTMLRTSSVVGVPCEPMRVPVPCVCGALVRAWWVSMLLPPTTRLSGIRGAR